MLNNISSNKDLLTGALTQSNTKVSNVVSLTASAAAGRSIDKSMLIDQSDISAEALSFFERDADIKKFTKLMMSDPSDLSHNVLVEKLFERGITDPYEDDVLSSLVTNPRLLGDIEK